MPEKLSRRDFLKVSGASLASLFLLEGCSNPTNQSTMAGENGGQSVPLSQVTEIPKVEDWEEITVPVDSPPNSTFKIDGASSNHFPNIGLKELHFIFDAQYYPLLALCCIWDADKVKVNDPGSKFRSKYRLGGTIGFQTAVDPFIPSMNSADKSLIKPNIVPVEKARQFAAKNSDLISELIGDKPYISIVKQRPETDQRLAIIFEDELVEYNGQPSPLSFLTAKFKFESSSIYPCQPDCKQV